MTGGIATTADYVALLAELKQRIQATRTRAALAVNAEQIGLYHSIGRELLTRREAEGWGAKVIDRLSADLRAAFPDMRGLSSSNLKYMRYFAERCPDLRFGQQPADQLPWFHVVLLLTKLDTPELAAWYAEHGPDRDLGSELPPNPRSVLTLDAMQLPGY